MRNFLFLIATAIITVSMIACHRVSSNENENGIEKDTLWYIDSVYIHRMGASYQESDSTEDCIHVFKTDEIGDIVQYDEITDSLIVHEIYDYSFSPDSIIKHTYFNDIDEEMYYSVYKLNDDGCITKLTQYIDDYITVTEYSYDMEGHLSMIYFGESDNHAKWLWRDGNLERIVWGDGVYVTEFRYNKETFIPFDATFYELPKLDVVLSRLGYFGVHPKNAIFVAGDMEVDEIIYSEGMYYYRGYPGVAVRQMCYQGIDYDSVEYNIHWSNVVVAN